jgi:hypothetical protein
MALEEVPVPVERELDGQYAMLAEAIITNPDLNGEVIRLDAATRLSPAAAKRGVVDRPPAHC